MTPTTEPPTATRTVEATAVAVLKRGREGFYWIVPDCPFCHKRHQHGGGRFDTDPRTFLGGRGAHCETPRPVGVSRQYVLVEDPPASPRAP